MLDATDKSAVIAGLTEQIRRLERAVQTIGPRRSNGFAFGVSDIDTLVSPYGFPFAGLHDIHAKEGEADFAVANAFVAFIASRLTGGVFWCVGRNQLYAPAISALGLSANKIVFFYARNDDVALAAMEEALRHPSLGVVVGEVRRMSLNASRRLILASEKSGVPAFTLRPPIPNRKPEQVACGTRWQLSSLPSGPTVAPSVGRSRWRIELERCRGSKSGVWLVEANGASNNFSLSAAMASRHETAPLSTQERVA